MGQRHGGTSCEMNKAAHDARDGGDSRSTPSSSRPSSPATTPSSSTASRPTLRRNTVSRDYLERKSYNLVAALHKLKPEATRFATDLRFPMTNNLAERDLRMLKLHAKILSASRAKPAPATSPPSAPTSRPQENTG